MKVNRYEHYHYSSSKVNFVDTEVLTLERDSNNVAVDYLDSEFITLERDSNNVAVDFLEYESNLKESNQFEYGAVDVTGSLYISGSVNILGIATYSTYSIVTSNGNGNAYAFDNSTGNIIFQTGSFLGSYGVSISPDGSKIAICCTSIPAIIILNGDFSFNQQVPNPGNTSSLYCTFNASSNILYTTRYVGGSPNKIQRYNLNTNTYLSELSVLNLPTGPSNMYGITCNTTNGELLVNSYVGGVASKLCRVNPTTGAILGSTTLLNLSGCYSTYYSPTENVYYVISVNNLFGYRYSSTLTLLTTFNTLQASFVSAYYSSGQFNKCFSLALGTNYVKFYNSSTGGLITKLSN